MSNRPVVHSHPEIVSASVDLLVRGLLATGATRGDVGAAFDPGERDPA